MYVKIDDIKRNFHMKSPNAAVFVNTCGLVISASRGYWVMSPMHYFANFLMNHGIPIPRFPQIPNSWISGKTGKA